MSHLSRPASRPTERDEVPLILHQNPRMVAGPAAPWDSPNPASRPQEPGWDLASHVDAVLDCLADHAIFTLDESGTITSWNRAAQATTGFRAADIIGRHLSALYPQADRRAGLAGADLRQAAASGVHRTEAQRLRANGEAFWASTVVYLVAEAAGPPTGYVVVTRDITTSHDLRTLSEERATGRRFEALGYLAEGMLDRFADVLAAIETGQDQAATGTICIADAFGATRRATAGSRILLGQVQAFARLRPGAPRKIVAHDLIASLDAAIGCLVGDTIELCWQLATSSAQIMVDPAQFQAALLTIALHGRNALHQGGNLTVFTEILPEASGAVAQLAVGVRAACGQGVGSIHRTGTAADLRPCEIFARQAGGRFVVEHLPGSGLNLTFTLPALALAAAPAAPGARTVLLVDDDANVLSLVGEMLTYLGHKVIPAHDGAEALRRLRNDRSIDSLFTDIVMPAGMNGMDLMREARATRPGLKTLLASIRSREDVKELGDIPQDVAFFAKPYALTEINAYLMA